MNKSTGAARAADDEPACDFAMAARDELWVRGSCVDSRLQHGRAFRRGGVIIADDLPDRELTAAAEEEIATLHAAATHARDAQLQLVASARRTAGIVIRSATITVTIRGVAVVSTAGDAHRDAQMLRDLLRGKPEADYSPLPIVWRNGSAAVLLHEAIGHAAEHDAPRVEWPAWLTVNDEPQAGFDDCGDRCRVADLMREPPASMRRASFRDVPLRRMMRLVARQHGAPSTMPEERIDVHVVSGGSYDPVTDEVSLRVVIADEVSGGRTRRLQPFTLVRQRRAVAASLTAATGEPQRYPGVICSREGQELVVGSFAPVIVTE